MAFLEVLMKVASIVYDTDGDPLDLSQCTIETIPSVVGNVTTYTSTATRGDMYGGGVWTQQSTITVVSGALTGATEGRWAKQL